MFFVKGILWDFMPRRARKFWFAPQEGGGYRGCNHGGVIVGDGACEHAPYGGGMNHLYYGDNLKVLRDSIRDESIDLIYLDPPFNSNASYNVLFKGSAGADSAALFEAFDDTWHGNDSAEEAFGEVLRVGNAAARVSADW